MATTPTNNPIPSEDPRDLKFNAGKLDEVMTSDAHYYTDRFGVRRFTIAGFEYTALEAIRAYGYITMDSFEDGATLTLPNQVLRYEATGEYYRWDGVFPKVVTTGSTPTTSGGIGLGAWVSVGDASLRSNLISDDVDKGDNLVTVKQPLAGAVSRTQHDKNTDFINVKDFGAKCDGITDDTSAVLAAINNGDKIYFPRGKTLIKSQIVIDRIVYLAGEGRGVSIIEVDSTTSDGIIFNLGFKQGGGLKGLTIQAKNDLDPQGTGSSGVGIHVINANDNFLCDDFEVLRFATSCRVTGSYQSFFTNFRFLYFATDGIHLAPYTAASGETAGNGCQFHMGKISNNGYTGSITPSRGIHIQYGSGEFFSNIDVQIAGTPVLINPPSTSWVRYLWMDAVLADTGLTDGFYLDASLGEVSNLFFDSCWSSNNTNNGVTTTGNKLANLRWQGGTIRGNQNNGINYLDGKFVQFDGAFINNNSNSHPQVYPGVYIAANTSQLFLDNCTIGNLPDNVANLHQGSGIVIEAGTTESLRISGCDLRAYGTGKQAIENRATLINCLINNNLPLQTGGVNPMTVQSIQLNTYNPVAPGSTVFLTPGGTGNQSQATMLAPMTGLINSILVSVSVVPGAGNSFTYGIYVNEVFTGVGVITGTGTYLLKFSNPILVTEGDGLSFSVVTSASANGAVHRASINFGY